MTTATSLNTPFFQSFDASRISSLIQKLSKMSEAERRKQPDFLGEGAHFQTFELAAKPLSLVVKIAKTSFLDHRGIDAKRWRKAISQLKQIEHRSLIPPMEVLEYQGLIALVMPKGRHLTRSATLTPAIETELYETALALGKAGLVLDDYPQLIECQGIPFIRDWSDLHVIDGMHKI